MLHTSAAPTLEAGGRPWDRNEPLRELEPAILCLAVSSKRKPWGRGLEVSV